MKGASQKKLLLALVGAITAAMAALGVTAGIYYAKTHPVQTAENSLPSVTTAAALTKMDTAAVTETTAETVPETTVTEAGTAAPETTESAAEETEPPAEEDPPPAEEPPAEEPVQNLPYISSAEIVAYGNEYSGGYNFKVQASGDFAYWTATGSAKSPGTSGEQYSFTSNDMTGKYPYFAGGSTLYDIQVTITPYSADGTPGNPVTTMWDPNRIEIIPFVMEIDRVTGIIVTKGATVPGYTTSYICEGGAESKVRMSLGDGWHIRSNRICFTRHKTWYELYDDWDGDYYGWVSSEYLQLNYA